MNKLFLIISIGFFLLSFAAPVYAQWPAVAGTSATPNFTTIAIDDRVVRLQAFFDKHNSPLTDEAAFMIQEADRLNLDWKLIAAIAGTESTFGKRIPPNSYNAWGWAIYTGNQDGKHFASWKDGITTVSEGIRYNYMDKGAKTIEQIGRIYAASPRWAGSVRFFLQKIETFDPVSASTLAVTI